MSSKQFSSILSTVPSATAKEANEVKNINTTDTTKEREELVKIGARVPISFKEELRQYIKINKGETESSLIIKGLIKLGFDIKSDFTTDRRKLR